LEALEQILSKYSKDKKRLREMINEESTFRSVSRKTADLINIMTNANMHYNKGEERVDMCEAIQGIRDDARAEGRAEGEAKGRAEGEAKGRAEGILETLFSLVRDGILTLSEAARRADMTETEFETKIKLLEQSKFHTV